MFERSFSVLFGVFLQIIEKNNASQFGVSCKKEQNFLNELTVSRFVVLLMILTKFEIFEQCLNNLKQ